MEEHAHHLESWAHVGAGEGRGLVASSPWTVWRRMRDRVEFHLGCIDRCLIPTLYRGFVTTRRPSFHFRFQRLNHIRRVVLRTEADIGESATFVASTCTPRDGRCRR